VRTPEGYSAFYDLEHSFPWLLSAPSPGAVHECRFLFEEGRVQTDNRLLAAVPSFAEDPGPLALGRDWVFEAPDVSALEPLRGAAVFRLVLLDLDSWDSVSFILEGVEDPGASRLHARGAVDFVRRVGRARGGPLVWSLCYELRGTSLRRAVGRLES